jgi:acyl-[acyl-carrier-protein]-phospholipid O-acyltransferase/long-chain-fatty-acid--[acyl-carrier-protein] ligase
MERTRERRGFAGLVAAQLLGAFNDSFFKSFLTFAVLDRSTGLLPAAAAEEAGGALSTDTGIAASLLFTSAFLLFSPIAGSLADRYSKRSVVIALKIVECGLMAAVILGFWLESAPLLILLLFLMAAQSALFSPSKYGILPELLPLEHLPRANGLIELSTCVAFIAGAVSSGAVYNAVQASAPGRLELGGALLTAGALLGLALSFWIGRVPAANPARRLAWNPVPELIEAARVLNRDRTMRLSSLGIVYFWSLAAVVNLGLFFYGSQDLLLDETRTGYLLGALGVGIGAGSFVAGWASRNQPELGLVPLGASAMALALLALSRPELGFGWSAAWLGALGFAGGFFIVPLNVLIQEESPPDHRGRTIAAVNLAAFAGSLAAFGLLWVAMQALGLRFADVFLILGLLTVGATAISLDILPTAFVRFLLWCATHCVYRIRLVGVEHVPRRGPALLVSNHVSYVDGLLLLASTHRPIRFVVYRAFTELRGLRWLSRVMRAIPISPEDGPRRLVASLREASAALAAGELVCVFAEGQITRTGQMLPFRSGVERILRGLDVPVLPVYLDRVWGSIFSFQGGKVLWKWPRRLPYPVTIQFGKPLPSSASAMEIRAAVQELSSDAFLLQKRSELPLPWSMVRYARRHPFRPAVADSTGARFNRHRFLAAAVFLARRLRPRLGDDPMAALLLPQSAGAAVANVAVSLLGKPVVNLNFTAGDAAMRSALEQCGVRKVLTSRAVLEKLGIEPPAEPIFIEDLRAGAGKGARAAALLAAWLLPRPLLRSYIGGRPAGVDDVATVIFSSGSTGEPKGVELTHFNVLANVQAIAQVFPLSWSDLLLGVLPFFHSTGYTATLWVPLLTEMSVLYHPNPLDARTIGSLAREHGATMIVATPTFLAGYTRRCQAEDFARLRFAVVGAEKLTPPVRNAFLEKFRVEPLEAYGCTECSPLITVNLPGQRGGGGDPAGARDGIGQPLPGVSVRVVDPETFAPRSVGEEGLLLVKGPNVMKGYLGKPDLTAAAVRDGWYVTGDVARLDADGFLTLTDRLSRFAKISGEMVPNVGVEEALHRLLDAREQRLVVTSVPDALKGEKLAVIHTLDDAELQGLIEKLPQAGLPNLWVPRRDAFVRVDALPILGTGKIDLRRVRDIALEALAAG